MTADNHGSAQGAGRSPASAEAPNGQGSAESPQGELTLRTLAQPKDVNVNGDIFGGWVLSQMDIAAGIIANERAAGRVTTVAVDAMKFIRPVKVGDILCVYGRIERVGRSSMGIAIEAWVRRGQMPGREKVTEAIFTFVAIDAEGRPRPVPQEAPQEATGSGAG